MSNILDSLSNELNTVPTKRDRARSVAELRASEELRRAKTSYSERRTTESDVQALTASETPPETPLWRKHMEIKHTKSS